MALHPDQAVTGLPEQYSVAPHPAGRIGEFGEFWWEALENPELDALIAAVLAGNRDLLRSDARVAEIQALAVAAGADRLPSLFPAAEAKRAGMGSRDASTYSLSLPAAFELDLWGRLARLHEAARFELLSARHGHRALTQSLAAQAASLYFQVQALEKRLAVADRSAESYRESLSLVEGRYRRGLASILDVRQADRVYAQSMAVIPALKQELQAARRNLDVLAGRFVHEPAPVFPESESFFPPPEVPAGLPSELLLRRPDVAAARAGVDAFRSRARAARAARFPALKLTGAAGYASQELDSLIRHSSQVWSAAAGLTHPLFNAGGLKAREDAASRRYEQAVHAYAQAVLTAFSEVEQALYAREQLTRRRELLLDLNQAAFLTLETARDRYKRGLVDYLPVLEAQQAWFAVRNELIGVEAALYQNFITLNRVLGGGWGGTEAAGKAANAADEGS